MDRAFNKHRFPRHWIASTVLALAVMLTVAFGGLYLFGENMVRSYLKGSGSAAVLPFIEIGLGEDENCGALIARAKKDAP